MALWDMFSWRVTGVQENEQKQKMRQEAGVGRVEDAEGAQRGDFCPQVVPNLWVSSWNQTWVPALISVSDGQGLRGVQGAGMLEGRLVRNGPQEGENVKWESMEENPDDMERKQSDINKEQQESRWWQKTTFWKQEVGNDFF